MHFKSAVSWGFLFVAPLLLHKNKPEICTCHQMGAGSYSHILKNLSFSLLKKKKGRQQETSKVLQYELKLLANNWKCGPRIPCIFWILYNFLHPPYSFTSLLPNCLQRESTHPLPTPELTLQLPSLLFKSPAPSELQSPNSISLKRIDSCPTKLPKGTR